ncbi:ethanolamine utilization protein EutQ [Lentilactobacillus sp. IMAU92037]|uniref:ethanolamine utilization protein EutQ n=1 Tax=Lentilactobacillus dabitei TaxID=2831523 RepID=UPI001C2B8E08|nr:ethanolamine utilization protein EutQ [Lentilactobacillus dabitei]MBV0929586.1 ethanolamine utilization protein EutQ [Lentilactobacillus dabitei]
MNIDRKQIEALVQQIVLEKLSSKKKVTADGLITIDLPEWNVDESDRMDTGNPNDQVYTKDFFDLKESPRLGAGLMMMKESTFDWTLNYDEVDYVISGELSVIGRNGTATAGAGQMILIPKGSQIKFSAPKESRFIYITYPADWEDQK